MRILVVENHADTRKYLTLYLEAEGHAVRSMDTMAKALKIAPQSDCNVLISDIGLPDGDGWELLRRAEFPSAVYAIAMSGYGMSSDEEKSREAGYRHHLLKPVDIGKLNRALADAEENAPL